MSEFYNILRQLRESSGMLQKEVADSLGLSPAAYSLYEKGQREPKLDMLQKIADFFNVSIDYLLTGENSAKSENNNSQSKENVFESNTIKLDITEENMKKYPEYFDMAFKNVEDLALKNLTGTIIDMKTGKEMSTEKFKKNIMSLTPDRKLKLLQGFLEKIEVNRVLDTMNIYYKYDTDPDQAE